MWTAAWWALAWTRLPWFAAAQRYTFFPLWIGFIVGMNALSVRAHGHSILTHRPRALLALFGVSAGFWWLFEWLNRFSRNWHYLGVSDLGAAGYAIHATLCFSTVLPAVTSVYHWLYHKPGWQEGCAVGARLPWLARRSTGMALLAISIGGLVATGAKPVWFYPALWIAPLALLLGLEIIGRQRGLATEVAAGDWRRAATWVIAALLCGFGWELWNAHSAAKWIYTVPYVERWHVFEMPLLGYLGYLPFGLECCYAVERTVGDFAPFSKVSST